MRPRKPPLTEYGSWLWGILCSIYPSDGPTHASRRIRLHPIIPSCGTAYAAGRSGNRKPRDHAERGRALYGISVLPLPRRRRRRHARHADRSGRHGKQPLLRPWRRRHTSHHPNTRQPRHLPHGSLPRQHRHAAEQHTIYHAQRYHIRRYKLHLRDKRTARSRWVYSKPYRHCRHGTRHRRHRPQQGRLHHRLHALGKRIPAPSRYHATRYGRLSAPPRCRYYHRQPPARNPECRV